MSNDPVTDFLNQNSGDNAQAFKFTNIGDSVGGTITRANIVDGTDLNTKQPTRTLVITVQPDSGDPAAIWVKPGNMLAGVGAAVRDAGRTRVEVGDRVAVSFVSERPAKTTGHHPAKIYEVAYKATAPAASGPVSASDLI